MKRPPNIIFCSHTSSGYMPPAELSPRQINVGVNQVDKRSGMGRIMSVQTAREFDLAEVVKRLPADQKPDLVIVLIDSFLSSVPRNLAGVECRKLLYIADTHHGSAPICTLLAYCQQEKFDRYAIAHDPHHYHWLKQAGLSPLAIHLNISAREPFKANFVAHRAPRIAFVGQSSQLHYWRNQLLGALEKNHVPLLRARVPAHEAAKLYVENQLVFNNCNGDVNMRLFETLAVGACLLTDKLSDATGMNAIFKDGEHLITYASEGELIEKAKHYLANPNECLAIAKRGHATYLEHFSETARKQRLLNFAFSTDAESIALAAKDATLDDRNRLTAGLDEGLMQDRVLAYEQMQELQRARRISKVCLSSDTPDIFASDMSDLMQISVSRSMEEPDETCLILTEKELMNFLSVAENPRPALFFVRPGSEVSRDAIKLLVENKFDYAADLMTVHPGCFERLKP